MKNKNYDNYFTEHYGYDFSAKDVNLYRQWFFTQWRLIKKYFLAKEGLRVLEIGSGIGGFYSFLDNADYIGLELDRQAVIFANKYFETNNFVNKNWDDFHDEEKVDRIVAFEVLEHLENPTKAIEKIFTQLNVGGKFIGTTPFPFAKNVCGDATHVSVLHPENWRRILVNAGFKSVEIRPMTFIPFLWRINKYLNIRWPFYFSLRYFISTSLIVATK